MQYEFITEAYLENIQTSEMDTVQKIKSSIENFFSKCDQIRNGKLHFLCSGNFLRR